MDTRKWVVKTEKMPEDVILTVMRTMYKKLAIQFGGANLERTDRMLHQSCDYLARLWYISSTRVAFNGRVPLYLILATCSRSHLLRIIVLGNSRGYKSIYMAEGMRQ